MIEKINKELVRISNLSKLEPTDDYMDLKGGTLYISEIYRLRDRGTKCYDKKNFYATLYLYETDKNKVALYNKANNFLETLEEEFFKDEETLHIDYRINRESCMKIVTDIGKYYQYQINLYITVY